MQETWVQALGWEDTLEKGKATHFSILAWTIPGTVKSAGSQRVRQDWATFTFTMDCSLPGAYVHGDSPGKNTGVGNLSLLQGNFLTQESNQGLLHCRQILYQLNHSGSLRVLEWVAHPFSSRSSRPRNQTGVSCIAGRFFTNWAIMYEL